MCVCVCVCVCVCARARVWAQLEIYLLATPDVTGFFEVEITEDAGETSKQMIHSRMKGDGFVDSQVLPVCVCARARMSALRGNLASRRLSGTHHIRAWLCILQKKMDKILEALQEAIDAAGWQAKL